ncbi:MAG: transcriptional repressor LexA [Parasporobacterium sp.]|nr:transcriptional repressor LexA [Parasporobacterium sp.]
MAKKTGLSDKQREILEYIKAQILQKGYPPSVREIGAAVGLSSSASVHAHLSQLEVKGYIRKDPAKPRTIELIDEEFALTRREFANIPIVGRVAAGEPILATENITDYFPLPADIIPNGQLFMLEVKGDSMINAGILDGDKVIVQQADTARNGEMVVALIDEGATVKYFYKENGFFRLQPDNPDYEPIITEQVTVLGKVIGVFRLW